MSPEILAPVGNREMAEAAFAAGCDAIYVAAERFGARAYAENFSRDGLVELIREAHQKGVRVYLALNTILKEEEVPEAFALLADLHKAHLDAVIIQDIGLISLLQQELPDLSLHASTQLSVTNFYGARMLRQLGFQRIVLGRETPLEEVARIRRELDVEVEIFVHGSLCVSVSGQCYLSSFAGGRSGNRGRCAQPCRKEYTLERPDGKRIAGKNTWLSPRDLMTLSLLPELVKLGVHSLKIEGRMKKPEYVFAAVTAYRLAMEQKQPDLEGLMLTTNRPFTGGFLQHQFGVDYAFSNQESGGLRAGVIHHRNTAGRRRVYLALEKNLEEGDVLRLEGKRGAFPITLTRAWHAGDEMPLTQRDVADGYVVEQVYASRTRRALQDALRSKAQKLAPLTFRVWLRPGDPIKVEAESGNVRISISGDKVQPAQNQGLTEERVVRAFQKIGQSAFTLENVEITIAAPSFLAMGQLNAARRSALEALERALLEKKEEKKQAPDVQGPDGASRWQSAAPLIDETQPEEGISFSGHLPQDGQAAALENIGVILETNRSPEAFGGHLHEIGRVVTETWKHAEAWRSEGIPVEWHVPFLMDFPRAEMVYRDAEAAGFPWDGLHVSTWNEFGVALEFMQRAGKRWPLSLGYGFHLANQMAIRRMEAIAREMPIARVELSIELTSEEKRPLATTLPVSLPVAGPLPGMVMRHCPASLFKGCHDDAECAHCPYSTNMMLVDEFGRRRFERKLWYTVLDSPEPLDLRDMPHLALALQPQAVSIIDRSGGTIAQVHFWHTLLKEAKSAAGSSPATKEQQGPAKKRTKGAMNPLQLGHYLDGVE